MSDKDKLFEDVKKIVDGIFSEKERADQINKTQEALNDSAKTIEDLTNSLESAKAEVETLKGELEEAKNSADEKIQEKDSKISEISSELEAAKEELNGKNEELESTKANLEDLKKDQLAKTRIKELEESKVLAANDSESQFNRVREMSDEEFAAYKTERVELRKAVEKELEETSSSSSSDSTDGNSSDGDNTGDNTGSKENAAYTPSASVSPGQAVAAAMNFEAVVSDDVAEKYKNLGKAMASNLSTKPEPEK